MKAIQGSLSQPLDLAWYRCQADSDEEAEAQRNIDVFKIGGRLNGSNN